MPASVPAPARLKDDAGFTHVLFSALGGDGANAAGKLLFQTAVEALDLDGAYDAKYGSEKTGTPTDVSIRLCEAGTPVFESGPTRRPHLLVAMREETIAPLALWKGLREGAIVIVSTAKEPAALRDAIKLHSGEIRTCDLWAVARETGARANVPMLALAWDALGFPPAAIDDAIRRAWPRAAGKNLAAVALARERVRRQSFAPDGAYFLTAPPRITGALGYGNMLEGGAVDALTHITRGRPPPATAYGVIPSFSQEPCTDCALCFLVCSDPGAVVFHDKKMHGIDEAYCKGCMKCVTVCPTIRGKRALNDPRFS
jgi:pyruvate ferredoxin oxidoreductase gamma subunit